jgi:hypothetical protein
MRYQQCTIMDCILLHEELSVLVHIPASLQPLEILRGLHLYEDSYDFAVLHDHCERHEQSKHHAPNLSSRKGQRYAIAYLR